MYKIIASLGSAAILLAAGSVSAQSYYPSYANTTYAGTCVSIARDLARGSRGSDVLDLQRFLVGRNYPGSGNWMLTSYFGAATEAAVRNFQNERGLAVTGHVDASTRAAISSSCVPSQGGNLYINPWYPTNPINPAYPTYPQQGVVTLSSLSANSGPAGASVTIYGTNLDYTNNTVYIGNYPLTGISSYNGTSLSFTVPSYVSGVVMVHVSNTRGNSNSLTFTVTNNSYPYPYPCMYGCNTGQISLQSLYPQSGAVGTTVTVYGTGFSTAGNSVRFSNGVIANLNSFDGTSLSFTVPSQLSGYGYQQVTLGTYNVSVTNSGGMTSNTIPFTVTSLGSTNAPTISGLSGPSTLTTGTTGSWTLTVYPMSSSYTTVSVNWGDTGSGYVNAAAPQTVYGQQLLTFTHAYYTPGTYTVIFTANNQYGQQNTASATVTVSGSGTSQLSLNSILPTSARVGTQLMLSGSGFNALDNTVYFGIGGSLHVPSFNSGTVIYYTVPQYVSPCDTVVPGSGTFCAQNIQQVMPGPIQVRVGNSNGQSNTLMFTVTQ
ncbi:IPT/TIG domain-containing protein [Candidatus Kaiserbacteria bacterium]|nr:IPT/TIG domain-containing protein [Candidatus Kaiserbacteria bacterium]